MKGEGTRSDTKGQRTRERIERSAAALFNQRGFAGTSIGEVLDATGLTKGALYNHFESKDALALAAFDYSCNILRKRFEISISRSDRSVEQLGSIIDLLHSLYRYPGGCPIFNTAVDADDTNPGLRDRARAAIAEWRDGIATCVTRGQVKGEIRPDVDGLDLASLMISCLEGALVLARLFGDRSHLDVAAEYLRRYVAEQVARAACR